MPFRRPPPDQAVCPVHHVSEHRHMSAQSHVQKGTWTDSPVRTAVLPSCGREARKSASRRGKDDELWMFLCSARRFKSKPQPSKWRSEK